MSGFNGQWVRTRDKRSTEVFLAEKQREAAKLEDRRRRSREFWARLWRRVRAFVR